MLSFDFIAVLLIVLAAFFFVAYRVIGLLRRRNSPSCCTSAEPVKKEADGADGEKEATGPALTPAFSLGSCAGCAFSLHCGVPSSSARKPKRGGGPEGKS